MIPLDQLSLGKRIVLTVIVVLGVCLFLLILSQFLKDEAVAQSQQTATVLYEGVTFDPSLLAIDKHALDEAYHTRIVRLFDVWLSSGAPEDAQQFRTGLRVARRGYAQAKEQIDRRERQLNALDQQQNPP